MTHGKAFRLSAAFAAAAMVFSTTASAAPVGASAVDPLVSLSLFGTSSSRTALCAAGAANAAAATGAAATAATAATAAQPGPGPGCVLPVLGSPPVVEAVPPPVGVAPVAAGFGLASLWPLAAAALIAFALAHIVSKDDDDDDIVPVTPD